MVTKDEIKEYFTEVHPYTPGNREDEKNVALFIEGWRAGERSRDIAIAQSTGFQTQIIAMNRLTIPAKIMQLLRLKEGDWIDSNIKKIQKKR